MKTKFFQMRVSEEFLKMLDDVRRDWPDLPSRTEVARRILEEYGASYLRAIGKRKRAA